MSTSHTRCILVVDDEDVHRMLIRRALENCLENITLREAASVTAAKSLLIEDFSSYKLAILDLNLGQECGLSILELIRAKRDLSELPCLMISTSDLPQDIEKSYAAGCNAYLVKEDDPKLYRSNLLKAVQYFMRS
ncbi:MAG: response regulator [Deltaproteobacteria bacterium]|nr:response regulator [Deltaproteobacteria bacterium]